RELEVIEHLGFGGKQRDDIGYVDRPADGQFADVDLDVVGDESRQHRDPDLATLNVELTAFADTDGGADDLDRYVDVYRLVRGDSVEVHVHRLATALVHLNLFDEDGVNGAVDIEVDEARRALGTERLVEGARLDAERLVEFAVVHDSRQTTGTPQRSGVVLRTDLCEQFHGSSVFAWRPMATLSQVVSILGGGWPCKAGSGGEQRTHRGVVVHVLDGL